MNKVILEVIQFLYLYLFPVHITMTLQRHYPTSLWRCYIFAMETSDDVVKTTSLQSLIMTCLHEMLQRRYFCNVVRLFHRNYMATSKLRRNDVVTTSVCQLDCSLTHFMSIVSFYTLCFRGYRKRSVA